MAGRNTSSIGHATWEALSEHQTLLWLILLLGAGLFFSTAALLVSVALLVLLRRAQGCVVLTSLVFGLLLLGIAILWASITPRFVHSLNTYFYSSLVHSALSSFPFTYWVLTAFPYGVVLSTVFAFLLRRPSFLQKELKRIESGKLNKASSFLPQPLLQKALSGMTASSVTGGTLLGINRRTSEPAYLWDSDANLHTLAIGTTGSGKTTGIANIVEGAIRRCLPVVYVDGKGDLRFAQSVARFAKKHGIPFYLFSMMGPSLHYNPIAFGGFTSKKDRLIELRHWSEDHYRKLAEGYLQTVFYLLERHQKRVDLHTVAQYLEPTALYRLARATQNPALVDKVEALEADYKNVRSLICEIKNIVDSEIGDLFNTATGEVIALSDVVAEQGMAYFCLQPLAFPAYAQTLGKLIINDLKALLASQLMTKEKMTLFAFFDEFYEFAGDQIVNFMNQGRSAGAHAVLATQSLSDIQRKGGNALLGQVLNNTNNYLIQRQNYPEDAEVLASIIGTQEAFEVTSQLSGKQSSTLMGTVRQARGFIVHPDEIKRLALGEAIWVNKQRFQVQPIYLRKGEIA